jgi:hypothetical protein
MIVWIAVMLAAPLGAEAVNLNGRAKPLPDGGRASEIDGARAEGTVHVPSDCQPLLPPPAFNANP